MDTLSSNFIPGAGRHTPVLNVQLVGDLVCPFCYIGKRRLDEALRSVHGPSTTGWYPFQLNPSIARGGESLDAYLDKRFGSQAVIQPALDKLTADGRAVGIDYRFDRLTRVPNTLPAHQVIADAPARGVEPMPLVEEFMAAYLTRGEDLGDSDVLVELGSRHGFGADDVRAAIASETLKRAVLAKETMVRESGISGVPGFLMNRRMLLVGLQEVDGIIAGFDRAMFGDEDGNAVDAVRH